MNAKPSVERGTQEHQAMLRAQAQVLLQQANAQAEDLQAVLSRLGNTAHYAQLSGALSHVNGVISELRQALSGGITSLRSSDLASLRQAVQAAAAAAQSAETAAVGRAGSDMAVAAAQVPAAAAETRKEVESLSRDLYDGHLFEPYLHFGSKEDEAEFRQREAERKHYIEEQLARHTPEGDLNSSSGMIGEMLDQHAHGAGDSPEFAGRWQTLAEKAQKQRAAMHAAGQSTEEYDRNVREAARRFLHDEAHLPDAEIEQKLKGETDPLRVVEPYLKNGHAARLMEETVKDARIVSRRGEKDKAGPAKAVVKEGAVASLADAAKVDGLTLDDVKLGSDPAPALAVPSAGAKKSASRVTD
jgi:hypothetical protein